MNKQAITKQASSPNTASDYTASKQRPLVHNIASQRVLEKNLFESYGTAKAYLQPYLALLRPR